MWLLRYLLFTVMLSVFAVIVLLFLGQNQRIEQLNFFGLQYTTNLVWLLLGGVAVGVLMALLFLLPGRVASALHHRSVERDLRQLEQHFDRLHEQRERLLARHEMLMDTHGRVLETYQRLVAEHSRVIAERDRARTLLAVTGTSPAAVAIARRAPAPHLAVVKPAAAESAAESAKTDVTTPMETPVRVVPNRGREAIPLQVMAPALTPQPARDPQQGEGSVTQHSAPAAPTTVTPTTAAPAPAGHLGSPLATSAQRTEAEAVMPRAVPVTAAMVTVAVVEPPATSATPVKPAAATMPLPVARVSLVPALLSSHFATDVLVPLAQQVAALPDQLRDCVREDVSTVTAYVAGVRAALAVKIERFERPRPLNHPSPGVSDSASGPISASLPGGDTRN